MSLQKEYQPVEMEEGIIAVAEAVPTPTASMIAAVPMIQVIAPATLPEGYTFEADIGGRVIIVTVPVGGIEEGQTIMLHDGGADQQTCPHHARSIEMKLHRQLIRIVSERFH
mmetsp:Transcript_12338/g.22439  ORF Transcript_12338/g.22439 Transcript_12338/m.22439 type:complete len:112 (-) Transcript_12338:1854-2189(-)